jgi:2-dehydro-3-deoxyphosphogluconate aldolase/(4S)-4-hydroxy-2-oxoglutarate aldolase
MGGIRLNTMGAYLALPSVAAVGGAWMADRTLIAEKNWTKIKELCREALRC